MDANVGTALGWPAIGNSVWWIYGPVRGAHEGEGVVVRLNNHFLLHLVKISIDTRSFIKEVKVDKGVSPMRLVAVAVVEGRVGLGEGFGHVHAIGVVPVPVRQGEGGISDEFTADPPEEIQVPPISI